MNILSATLGRVAAQYRTFGEWRVEYEKIISTYPLSPKTLQGRRCCSRHLSVFDPRCIGSIRPHEIAQRVREIHTTNQHTARRVLIVAREMLGEAVNYGWIHNNPTAHLRQLLAKIKRRRLKLEEWQALYEYAQQRGIEWVPRCLRLALITGQRRADLQKMAFSDVWDNHLHVQQQKTGARIALPLSLRLDAIGITLGEVIEDCRHYASPGKTLLRKPSGASIGIASLSFRFSSCWTDVFGPWEDTETTQPTLHECRSLSERLYRAQRIDTQTLLGHKNQSMTDEYNDDRGLNRNEWKRLILRIASIEA